MQMRRPINRIPPQGRPSDYTSYAVHVPKSRRRQIPCQLADCDRYQRGWRADLDESTDEGARTAAMIRRTCINDAARRLFRVDFGRRRYTEHRLPGGATRFVFPAGQQCFRRHEAPPDADAAIYFRRPGDYRVPVKRELITLHTRPDLWVEDFAEHQARLASLRNRA